MSFKLKTILLILSVSLIPYSIIMGYFANVFKEEFQSKTILDMNSQLDLTVNRIDEHMTKIKKDMTFMASMDIMNDVYGKDLDKRISTLLLSKKEDLDLIGDFFVLREGEIIASSDMKKIFTDIETLQKFLSVDIVSKFDNEVIAQLILSFPLENLKQFFYNTQTRIYYIRNDDNILLKRSILKTILRLKRLFTITQKFQ